ncbi:MAG: TonB-dependent receptor [Prolixibacteraceae bacterium]|jgi:vitamin B12 transporter|nr:TonB-dependent receptor [Prolixibacteraceae bacterium]
MRHLLFVILVLAPALYLWAEEPEPYAVYDSIFLDEITTYGDYIKYQPGAHIVNIKAENIENSNEPALSQLLSRYSPIYIKTDAGGLATIRIRGTAPNHTTINFGGININSLTLGHSNISSVSMFLFDRIELQYGSSSSLNGSGAIGGSIYLNQKNQWTDGFSFQGKTMQGSFGEQLYGAKIALGNGKFESITKLYLYKKKNNFPFKNPYHENRIEDRTPVDDVQKGAAIENKGILQQFNYLFTPNEFFKSSFWFENSWHQVQPNMQTNIKYKTTETLENKNIRAWVEYRNENNPLKYNIAAGYVHDYQLYDSVSAQEIITDRLITEASAKYKFRSMEFKLGTKYKYMAPDVYAYTDTSITNEQYLDIYLSWFFQPTSKLKTAINLRQTMVSEYNTPFTPSLGADYTLIVKAKNQLNITANLARSYRVPTFNDRFWGNQGNPNLKPETGINIEGGLKYNHIDGSNKTTVNINTYYMNIDNWIEWRYYGVWQAHNIQRVISKGIEVSAQQTFKLGNTTSEININYTLNNVEAIENKTGSGITNHQLRYSPKHIGNASYQLHYHNWSFYADGSYTGLRYTDYLGDTLPAYFLTNAGLHYSFKMNEHQADLSFSADNLFDVSYQNQKYYAMPGRTFRIGLSIKLNY